MLRLGVCDEVDVPHDPFPTCRCRLAASHASLTESRCFVEGLVLSPTRGCGSLAECGKGRTAGGGASAERMLEWAAECVGGGARVVTVRALHGREGPWLLGISTPEGVRKVVLRAPTSRIDAEMIVTGAAALEVAERHGVPAPRLVGRDLEGSAAGVPATLESVVGGSTAWPRVMGAPQLRLVGAALARVHAVSLTARDGLPVRTRPIAVDDFAGDRRRGAMGSTPLLRVADEWIRRTERPRGTTVFVHGDVWPGNVVRVGDSACVLIDWKTAGVGNPGVDLGELRKQMAFYYGLEAIDAVVDGWEQAAGRAAVDLAYWDVVAALNTRTDLGPVITGQRDEFLRDALARLDR
ncbi:phosphotransferase family protein [Kribbella sp. CA-253562]|uniref:phosphotransferase family protein n=1 Tax=Kribbella sp. CA-253562 TaxID=3239942 RepID=UPI003D8A0956